MAVKRERLIRDRNCANDHCPDSEVHWGFYPDGEDGVAVNNTLIGMDSTGPGEGGVISRVSYLRSVLAEYDRRAGQ